MKFIAATNNAGKMEEIRRILTRMGHTVVSQQDAGIKLEPEELGKTFAENARIKAQAIAKVSGCATIADDSGLCVDGLLGAPGVHSARYCGYHGNDEGNNDKLLKELSKVTVARRGARFVSCVCICLPENFDHEGGHARNMICEGVCTGEIGFTRLGTNGFGYDSLFIPTYIGTGPNEQDIEANKLKRTYAQLSAEEKDAISHRGMAMRDMERCLEAFLDGTWDGNPDTKMIGRVSGPADSQRVDLDALLEELPAQTQQHETAQEQEKQPQEEIPFWLLPK